MILRHIIVGWRNMRRNKFYTVINLTGLTIGISSFLLVVFFIRYEHGYDRFHPDNVYRLGMIKRGENNAPQKIARTMFPMGPTLRSDFSEVSDFTRIIFMEKIPLQQSGKPAIMATSCGADSTFFSVFNFKLLQGDPQTALAEPNSIVLTRDLATRLFRLEDPVGRLIEHQGRDTTIYVVTGILEDIPAQSHLRFEAVHSLDPFLASEEIENWDNEWVSTYIRLAPSADIDLLEASFPKYLQHYMGSEKAEQYQLLLQPLTDIHLWSSDFSQDLLNKQKFNGNYLYLLAMVSVLVLLLAIINYVTLTTARTIHRAREIAVKKTNGASQSEIVYQFLAESLLFTGIALCLSLALIGLVFEPINAFSERK